MSRDVIPSIEYYRTQHSHQQVQAVVRRPTMHELCNPVNEVLPQNFHEVKFVC